MHVEILILVLMYHHGSRIKLLRSSWIQQHIVFFTREVHVTGRVFTSILMWPTLPILASTI